MCVEIKPEICCRSCGRKLGDGAIYTVGLSLRSGTSRLKSEGTLFVSTVSVPEPIRPAPCSTLFKSLSELERVSIPYCCIL